MTDSYVLQRHLADSTLLVLERMCSLIPTRDEGLTEEQRERLACVQVKFTGTVKGSFLMAAEEDAAQLFAPAFLGIDGEDLSAGAVQEVLAEMANMICGAAISRIEPGGLFSLSTPAPSAPLPPPENCAAELDFDCGCGSLIVQLQIEQ